jgi:signal transduction histidine kinase
MPAMHAGGRRRIVAVVGAYVALGLAAQLILTLTPYPLFRTVTLEERLVGLAVDAVWIVALVVLLVRQPTSSLWKIVLLWEAAGNLFALGYLPVEPRWLLDIPLFLVGDLWAAVFIHLVLAYPSGRLADRIDRRLVTFAYVFAIGIKAFPLLLSADPCYPTCDSPVRWFPSQTAYDAVQFVAIVTVPIVMLATLAEYGRHWRAAGPVARRALRPMLVAAPIWCVTVFAGYIADAYLDEAAQDATHTWNALGLVQALAIPVAIIVGGLRTSLARGNVADLAVELGRGVPTGGLEAVLARAMRDPSLRLAFPAPTADGLVDAEGHPVVIPADGSRAATPIERDGETLALLIHDPASLAEDPGLVEAVGSVARMALENERLAAQVRAQLEEVRESRARLVEAGDAERRRIERDLHDGAQQRLTALAIRLQTARATMPEAADLLDATTAELQAAIGDVRDLARGVHPTLLHEVGLAAAVDALAERSAIPVEVDIPEGRLPDAVESTAYFVVAEALTNISKYAEARRARVEARVDGERLVATIHDDGRGGADPAKGTGLRGLADRVAAARGRFDVSSPADGGTTIRFELPLA